MYDARREKATVGQRVGGGWELVVVVVARQIWAVLRVRRDRKKGISSPQSCVRQLNMSNSRLQPLLLVVFTLVTAAWPGRVNRSASVLHSAEPLSAAAVTCETESLATLTPHSNCFFFFFINRAVNASLLCALLVRSHFGLNDRSYWIVKCKIGADVLIFYFLKGSSPF